MAESPSPAQSSPPKKQRSSIERAIVWGGIVILLGIVAYEYKVKRSFDNSHIDLHTAWEKAAFNKSKPLTEEDVKRYVHGYSTHNINQPLKPNPSNAQREDTYTFTGLVGRFSEGYGINKLYVVYGQPGKEEGAKAEVMEVGIEPMIIQPAKTLRDEYGDGRKPKSDDESAKPAGFSRSEEEKDQNSAQPNNPDEAKPSQNENEEEEKPADPVPQ